MLLPSEMNRAETDVLQLWSIRNTICFSLTIMIGLLIITLPYLVPRSRSLADVWASQSDKVAVSETRTRLYDLIIRISF